jgi:hypothetical protein
VADAGPTNTGSNVQVLPDRFAGPTNTGGTIQVLPDRYAGPTAQGVVEVLTVQVTLAAIQAALAHPKAFNETTNEALLARIEATLGSRSLWADVAATLIQIGNGGGSAVLNVLAGTAQDLTLGARGVTIPLNDAGNLTPTSGASLVGGVNAALAAAAAAKTVMTLVWGGNAGSANDNLRAYAEGDAVVIPSAAITDSRAQIMVPGGGTITEIGWISAAADGTTVMQFQNDSADIPGDGVQTLTGLRGTKTGLNIPITAGFVAGCYYKSGTAPGNTLMVARIEP